MSSPARRLAAGLLIIASALGLAGCTRLQDVAIRLNADGTLDFGSCETLDTVDRIEAETYVRTEYEDTATPLSPPVTPPALGVGDVLSLGTVPSFDTWDRIDVKVYRSSGNSGERVDGIFDLRSLRVGNWIWATDSSLFDRAPHCVLHG